MLLLQLPPARTIMHPALHALPDLDLDSSRTEERAAQLLAQIGQSDSFAFDTLYALWSPTLLGIAFRMLGNRAEAEEAMQDTFVKIWHRAADFDAAKSKAFVWCFTILRSTCIDRLRHQHRQKRNSQVTQTLDEQVPEPLADAQILSADTFRSVRLAMDQLPLDERRCLELAVFLEYTHSEIAERLSTPLGTIKNRLRRALDKLKQLLSDHEI